MSKSITPRIYPRNPTPADMSKNWRVWFKYPYQGKEHFISRQETLLDCKTFKDRKAQAAALVDYLQEQLDRGWNPVTNTFPIKSVDDIERERLQNLPFHDALDFAYGKKLKDWKHKTSQDYRSILKNLKRVAPTTPISEMKRRDYKQLLENVSNSSKSFNKYRSMLSGLISELVEWDILEYNPIRDIKTKQEQKTFAHRPPTQDEKKAIVARLKQYPEYFRFVSVAYGCGIRPGEIRKIRLRHLHKQESIFRLTKEVTKTGNERDVYIPKWVMGLLSEMNLHNYSSETFLFGVGFLPGKQLPVNKSHKVWKELIKDGLKIDVDLYGLKKLAGDDMVKLQMNRGVMDLLRLPQIQFGHEDKKQTETYVNAHRNILKEVIVNYMPEL